MKHVSFRGDSLDRIRDFSSDARRVAGFQIDRLQRGLDPNDWKPLKTIGPGVREIRIRDRSGAFRVVYLAALEDAIYVLHAFEKKTQATSRSDIELATTRYKELLRSIKT
jgi:phage-related protein